MDNIDVATVVKTDNTAGTVASDLVEKVIMGLDPNNINNSTAQDNKPQTTYVATSADENTLADKINQHVAAAGHQEPVVETVKPKLNIADVMPIPTGDFKADKVEIQGIIDNIQNMFEETYEKKFKDLEAQQQKRLEEYKMEVEKEKISKMTESEKRAYETELQRQAEVAKLKFMEQRIKELEEQQRESENKVFIQQQLNTHPYVRNYIDKMHIKTKEEYKLKIEPILNDIKELELLRTNNSKYGNSNALGGFNKKSDERKDITESIKTSVDSFLDKVIMR